MYIPPAKYPKSINIIKMYPELFTEENFKEFALTPDSKGRFRDFYDSAIFLYVAPQEKNYGSKLIMLLSSIERSIVGRGKTFQDFIKSEDIRRKLLRIDNVKELRERLDNICEEYNKEAGSIRPLVNFFKNYLTEKEKLSLINGIKKIHSFKIEKTKDKIKCIPITEEEEIVPNRHSLDKALTKVVKGVIYDIRNYFVHRASYFPFPDRNTKTLRRIITEGKIPKEEWLISIRFEDLYKIVRNAFIKYWKDQYEQASKSIKGS